MDPYLEKLRALNLEKRIPRALTKPTKPGFVGFVDDHGIPYFENLADLRRCCPECMNIDRWATAIADGEAFLAKWGRQAKAIGWTAHDLFGLHNLPARPHTCPLPGFIAMTALGLCGFCRAVQCWR